MAGKAFKISFLKKAAAASKKMKAAAPGDTFNEFVLVEGTNDDVTVSGVDASGNLVDISGISTTVAVSDNPSILEIGPPLRGGTYNEKAVGPTGSCNVTVTTTMNDGLTGPFTYTYPVTVGPGAAGGITITHGTPVPN